MKSIFSKTLYGIVLVVMTQQVSAFGLAEELAQKDAELFKRGFNECDTAYLEQHVSDDLIFYHDKAGIQDKEQFMSNVVKNICSNPKEKPIRKLVDGSIEIFPLHKNGSLYGAIQQGEHKFYIRKEGYPDSERLLTTTDNSSVYIDAQREINRLSTIQQKVFIYAELYEHSHTEISELLQIPLGSVKTYLKQTREQLKVQDDV